MKKNTAEKIQEKEIKETIMALNSSACEYESKIEEFSISDLIKMVGDGRMKPAEHQRKFITKHASDICASIITGRGVHPITATKQIIAGKTIYFIDDGVQRLCSILIYVLGVTVENWEGKIFIRPENKRPTVIKSKDFSANAYGDNSSKFCKNIADRRFEDLAEEIQELILNKKIRFEVRSELRPMQTIQLYSDLNTGSTKLNTTEILKAISCHKLWNEVEKYANKKHFDISTKERFSHVKLMFELFSIYLEYVEGMHYMSGSWGDTIEDVCKLNSKEIFKVFNEFKKYYDHFEESMIIKSSTLTRYESKKNKHSLDAYNLRVIFMAYCKDNVRENEKKDEDYYNAFSDMITTDCYVKRYSINGTEMTLKEIATQGVGQTSSTKKAYSLINSHYMQNYYNNNKMDYLYEIVKKSNLSGLSSVYEVVKMASNKSFFENLYKAFSVNEDDKKKLDFVIKLIENYGKDTIDEFVNQGGFDA